MPTGEPIQVDSSTPLEVKVNVEIGFLLDLKVASLPGLSSSSFKEGEV